MSGPDHRDLAAGSARLAVGLALAAAVGCGDAAGPGSPDATAVVAVTAVVDAAIDADVNGPAAFRISVLELGDPHVYASSLGCRDVTDEPLMQFSVNGAMQAGLTGDADGDGALDESIVTVFRPLAQGAATSPLELHRPRCSAPLASTSCARSPAAAPVVATTANNLVGVTCLSFTPGTVRPYMPPIGSAIAPCYRSDPMTLTLAVGGLPIPPTSAHRTTRSRTIARSQQSERAPPAWYAEAMIARIATFNTEPAVDPDKHEEFRRWMGTQPGMIGGYHLHDPATGKVVSISFWTDRAALMAMRDRVFPGGPLGLKPDAVEIFDVAHTFGPVPAGA